jgi:hypothetical protein
MSKTICIQSISPISVVHCENCGWSGLGRDVVDFGTTYLEPGSVVPAGRCPKCQALAYVDESEPESWEFIA